MQLDVSARHTAAPGRDEDSARHNAVTTLPGPAHENHRPERAPSESNLPESEQLFRTAFERAVIGIAHVSPEGRWLRFNQRLCDLLGYDRAELAALTFQDVTYPDDLAACGEHFQHLLAGEINEYAMDKRYIRKDGTLVWTHIAVSLVRTPEGAPDFTITMIQDISERKRLEQDRAQLLEHERAARLEAEATNARLGALQALTDTALSSLALDDLLRELLGRVPAVMGVDHVAIFLLEEDGRTLTARAIRGEEVGAVGLTKIRLGRGVAGRIAASREPVIVDDMFTNDMVYPWHRETLRSVVGVPLLAEGHLVGVVLVGSAALRRFTDADVQLLLHAADRIGLAVDRARLYAAEQDARQHAEAALARAQASEAQASERAEQLHTILETMTDGVAVTDAEGRYLQTNRAYRELVAADRLPGFDAMLPAERGRLSDMRDLATGGPLPSERMPTARALRGEVVTGPSAEILARAFDGRQLEVNASATPLRDRDGHIVGAVSVLRDVTWRRQLEHEREAARAQAEAQAGQLDRIYEALTDGLIVYDPEGRMVRTNAAARRILGLDAAPPDAFGRPLPEWISLFRASDSHGTTLAAEEVPAARVLRGEVLTGPHALDLQVRTPDGREISLDVSGGPLRDYTGRLVGAVCVYRDQTDRRQLERDREAARVQAETQADQLDRIFEAAAEGLIVWDAEGRIARTNAAAHRILGLDAAPPDFCELSPSERLARYAPRDEQGRPLSAEEWPFMCAMQMEGGTGQCADIRMRVLDGREIEINASSAPLRDREGHLVGAVCVIHDQTERRRLEREREEARANELATREVNRRMEQFLATAAHDTRTPLTATLGYVELAQRQFQRLAAAVRSERPDLARQVEAVRGRLDEVGHGAERLSRLVEVLFDTAAIRSGRLELHRAPCDLAALVGEQVAEQRMAAPHRTIRLHTPAAGWSIPVEADADRIGQVVANLLTNALKYAPPEHPVDVSVEVPVALGGGWARVAVRDRGPGLPEAEKERVWEPFHRAQGIAAQGGKQSGVHVGSLGLGLHICKAIVEAHGGRVGVESAVGEGSTFWFTLPLAQAAGAAAA